MKIKNVHERKVDSNDKECINDLANMLDHLSSDKKQLWAPDPWPALKLNRGLSVGSKGGHGPILYKVSDYKPGLSVEFEFLNRPGLAQGLIGHHALKLIMQESGSVLLRHTIIGNIHGFMLLKWPLIIRPLHDALIEDAFDLAQERVEKRTFKKTRHSMWVRFLLKLLPLLAKKKKNKSLNRKFAKSL